MARKRPAMPSVAAMQRELSTYRQRQMERQVASMGQATARNARIGKQADQSSGRSARAENQRNMTYEVGLAIQEAKNGDDSALLPYQPTPSINPPRPRTLAAGYDPTTQTMRVKFRDGAVYAYTGVPPRVYRNFKRVKSPGRMVTRVLDQYPYYQEF